MAIYDCFTFFNEFELLELRLKMMNELVDYFVIVEANVTLKGIPKKFNYLEKEQKFKKYKDKIKYIAVSDNPVYSDDDIWIIERHQRNSIMRGLADCKADDLIIISDIDEIPNVELIEKLYVSTTLTKFFGHKNKIGVRSIARKIIMILETPKYLLNEVSSNDVLVKKAIVLEQELYYYFLNCRSRGKWYGSIVVLYGNLTSPQKLRDVRNILPRIENGGWHFSYLGGIEKIKLKLNSIIEGNPNLANDEYILKCLNEGKDLYGRRGKEFEYDFISIDQIGVPRINEFIEKYPYLYQNVIG